MWGGVWAGGTVVIMASGPSLTQDDVETVRQWREGGDNRHVIVTNTTYKVAPWADALFFHDFKWWKQYKGDVRNTFRGQSVTVGTVNTHDVDWLREWNAYGNSGTGAIALSVLAEARRAILLGVDCKYAPDGRRHHHGDHPPGLGNAKSAAKWPTQFKRVAAHARHHGVEVINCSRDTALTCFDRQPLEVALCLN